MKRLTGSAGTAAVCLALTVLFCAAALAETETPQFTGSIAAKQENLQALRLARTTLLDAVVTASAQQPAGQIVEAGLDVENGFLIYGIDVLGAADKHTKILIDAGNGKLLATFADEKDTHNVQVEEGDSARDADHHDSSDKPEPNKSSEHQDRSDKPELNKSGDHKDGGDKPDLTAAEASKARVTLHHAVKTALAATPGTAVAVKLDSEKGTLVYEIDVLGLSGRQTTVTVNAVSGKVAGTEQEDSEENDNGGE